MALSDIGAILVKRYQAEFLSIISILDGSIDLVLEKELLSLLDQISPIQFLKSHGVGKIFYLEPEMNVGSENRVYLVRPIASNIKDIYNHFKYDSDQGIIRRIVIIFVPCKTQLCEEQLESYGLVDLIGLYEWHIDLIPLDFDLLSLESGLSLKNYLMNTCSSIPYMVATSLLTLYQVNSYNSFTLHTVGEQASEVFRVFNLLKSMSLTLCDDPIVHTNYFSDIILIDRKIDLVSPILTQLSYEGLLDDNFGIHCGSVTLSGKVTGKSKPTKLMLNSNDLIYSQVRGYHISFLLTYIKDQLKALISRYDKGRMETTISEMKSFVGELKTLKPIEQSLVVHLCACEALRDIASSHNYQKLISIEHALLSREPFDERDLIQFFEDMLCSQTNWRDVLRIMCLYSMLSGTPLKDRCKHINYFERQFIRAHGYSHINTLVNLQHLGLLNPMKEDFSRFQLGVTKLGLIPKMNKAESLDLAHPSDISFVFGGAFKPLSCVLIESFFRHWSWKMINEISGIIKFPITSTFINSVNQSSENSNFKHKKCLIYFIGGCSFSEINAIRFIRKNLGIEVAIATTFLLNKNSVFHSLHDSTI